MSQKNTSLGVVVIVGIAALGVGYVLGGYGKSSGGGKNALGEDPAYAAETKESLSEKVGLVLLPEDEYNKLTAAIYQTAMGLLSSRAQSAGIELPPHVAEDLQKSVSDKYNRAYFAKLNIEPMSSLEKNDLVEIIKFFETSGGKKFSDLSPKVMANTMGSVRNDMATWIPETIENMMTAAKGSAPGKVGNAGEGNAKPNSGSDKS